MHDGPGVRTTVFLKGCPLSCVWCHNPETGRGEKELLFSSQKCISCGGCLSVCPNGVHVLDETHTLNRTSCVGCGACAKICPTRALSLCGRDMSVSEILSVVERDRAFFGDTGGITLSGGEPFFQGEGTLSLLRACREAGISTAVETCGYADSDLLLRACSWTDLFLWDLKDTDGERHRQYTGVSNERILKNLRAVANAGANIRLRCILVHGINANAEHYERVARIAKEIPNLQGIDVLPYHAYGGSKSTLLGKEDNGRADWIPTESEIQEFHAALRDAGWKE